MLVACLTVLGVLVVTGLLPLGSVTQEEAEQAAVDFASRNTPAGVARAELAASCGPSGEGWLCGVGTTNTACANGEVGEVTVDSSGTAVPGNLTCRLGDDPPAPHPFSDELKIEASLQTLIKSVYERIVAGDYDGAWNLFSKRRRAQIERRDGFDKWRHAQEIELKSFLKPSRAEVELQELNRETGEATVRVTGMGWSKPGASCESWSGITWAKFEGGRWRYDPGLTTTPERESRWKARYDELLGTTC